MSTQSPRPDPAWFRRFQMRIKKKKCTTCGGECTDCPYAAEHKAAGKCQVEVLVTHGRAATASASPDRGPTTGPRKRSARPKPAA